MNYRMFIFKKRNGEGQSMCDLCKCITWDCMCYDLTIISNDIVENKIVVCCECREHIN